MKNKITILISLIAIGAGINGNAQAVSEGNIIIDPYYGGPNFGKTIVASSNINIDKSTSVGPMGLRVEYMVADNFGIGIDFIYNSTNITGTIDSLLSDNTHQTYSYKLFSQRYRPQIRMNYHFVANEALDVYTGIGVGANIRNIGIKTDYPNYDNISAIASLSPVSLRLALGMRYYFTENIGLNLELGLGGPFMSGGLSIKF